MYLQQGMYFGDIIYNYSNTTTLISQYFVNTMLIFSPYSDASPILALTRFLCMIATKVSILFQCRKIPPNLKTTDQHGNTICVY